MWERNEGINGGTESLRTYSRFVQYLHLGTERSLAALARILNVTDQACWQQCKRYNWEKRAAAFDAAVRKGNAPSGPAPPKLAPSIIPEVLPERKSEAISLAGDHLTVLARYQTHYEELGRLMAEEACDVFPLIRAFREDIDAARVAWRQLVDQKEVQLAQVLCLQLQQLIPLYCRLSEAMHSHANGGRQHWGDAIGVQAALEQAYGSRRDKS
jgi:hypothetical protein